MSSETSPARMVPKLVAFDLDGTIWTPDMYMLWGGGGGPPFRVVGNEELRDRRNAKVGMLGISGEILDTVATADEWKDTRVAWVSCTDEPGWADECMAKFKTPMGVPLVDRVQEQCIYKADKRRHFEDLQRKTKIAYEDMIFFDNERGNIHSVGRLGVHSVHCPDGMTRDIWESGIESWLQQRK